MSAGSDNLVLCIAGLVLCSIFMVAVLVPFSAVLILGEDTMRGRGRDGTELRPDPFFAERLIPPPLRRWPPLALWGSLYGLAWAGIIAMSALLVRTVPSEDDGKNWLVFALVIGGFAVVQALIIVFARAIVRANQRAAQMAPAGRTETLEEQLEREDLEILAEKLLSEESGPTDSATSAESEAEPEQTLQPPPAAAPRSLIATVRGWVLTLFIVFVALVAGELIAPVKQLEAYLIENRTAWLAAAIAFTSICFLLFMGGTIHLVLTGGRPMSLREIEQHRKSVGNQMARPYVWRRSIYRVGAAAVGSSGHDQFSLRELKQAWAARAWQVDAVWGRRFVIVIGALGMGLGIFSSIFVLAVAGLKLLVAAAVLYATVQFVSAWRRM